MRRLSVAALDGVVTAAESLSGLARAFLYAGGKSQRFCDIGMTATERLFSDRQRAPPKVRQLPHPLGDAKEVWQSL